MKSPLLNGINKSLAKEYQINPNKTHLKISLFFTILVKLKLNLSSIFLVMDKEDSKKEIAVLIEKCTRIVQDREVVKFNEERTKAEFIEPLFESLGWDVRNRTHKDEVTREEAVSKKRVDYGFRINGIPKFFLEAKALSADLDEVKFFEQAVNYAYWKGCTWAVLTNFETVKVFNAEWKSTSYSYSNFITIRFDEFLDKFDQLWLLAKESFEQGLLDKEAERWGKKIKKAPPDQQLLTDFTKFRDMLSKSITKMNSEKHLSEEELDESVQRILDRLIFIRNCEDRGWKRRSFGKRRMRIGFGRRFGKYSLIMMNIMIARFSLMT